MDDPNITMEEYIRLEEEKARKCSKVFNWETAKYGKVWYDEDIHNLKSVEIEFPAITFNDEVSFETLSCEPMVSSINNEIDFRISFDDEDYTVIFKKNLFSYKIVSTNDLKTDSENDNENVNLPSLPSLEPAVSCFDDLDFFKDFENKFPAIVYNNAQTSKSDLLTEPIFNPQHIDEFYLNDETSLFKYDEEEQNVLYFNDLFPFNIIHPDDLKSEKNNDDNDIDMIQSSGAEAKIIMVNVIPPDHVDDVPVVEPNQHDDVLVVPEPVLKDEDEDSQEEEFEEEEEPQEEEDDMEVDIEKDENELELAYPYEEVDPLNPPPPASKSEPEDVIEIENTIEHEDESVPASVHEVGESSTATFLREDSDGLFLGLMRRDINLLFGRIASLSRRLCGRETAHALVEKKGKTKDEYYGKLILDLGNKVRSSVEQGTAAMEKLVEKLGNAEGKVECKKLKKELEEVRGFVFEERLNEAINVLIEDEKTPSSEPRGSPYDSYVDTAIAAERARHVNARNDARGSGPVMGQDVVPAVCECTFAGFMKCNPTTFHEGKKVKFVVATLQGPTLTWWNAKVATMGLKTVNQMPWTEMKQLKTAELCSIEEVQRIEHELWNLKAKEYNIVAYTQRFNELALMCPRMVKLERLKVDAYIRGLTDNIKGEVTSSNPANLNEAIRMAHKLME
ncbi:putative reverse transcriptase domain-containing protein [Tanacetum coccineum]